jgi:MFS superfamily sulfate permease-like transporter
MHFCEALTASVPINMVDGIIFGISISIRELLSRLSSVLAGQGCSHQPTEDSHHQMMLKESQ